MPRPPTEETIGRVLDLVSHLGGTPCTPDELRWVADIPAGRQVLEWIATQVPEPSVASAGFNHHADSGVDLDRIVLQSSLSPISLYQDELLTLARLPNLQAETATTNDSAVEARTRTPYELPSQLRSRAEMSESEADMLEKQTKRLKYRLSTSKAVAKDLKQAIHALKKQIQSVDETVKEQQQRLADLSAETDGDVARHVNLAISALQEAVPQGSKDSDPLEEYRAQIASLSSDRATIASAVKRLYQTLDDGYNSLPTASEVQHDAERLHAKLKETAGDQSRLAALLDAAYVEDLEKIAEELERAEDGPQAISQILQSVPLHDASKALPKADVDVRGELELAGQMDHLALLRAQEDGLGIIIDDMRAKLIPRLQRTYDDLRARSVVAMETEAIVSALLEELEDVNDAVEGAKRPSIAIGGDLDDENPESILEAELTNLLKRLAGSHGRREDRLTVLLNRSDVESELAALSHRISASRQTEEKWTAGLRERIYDLSSNTAPLLRAAYANSPVNTSSPFAPVSAQAALQDSTRAKAEALTAAAARLQKETELSSRDKRKLGAFVDKWAAN